MPVKRKTSKQKDSSWELTEADVREVALALPSAEERPSYGTPGFRVSEKLFARVLDAELIVIKVEFDHREVLLREQPEAFAVTPHYQGYPMVIVRLGAVDRELLRALLKDAWRMCASPRLLKAQASALTGPQAQAVKPRARRAARTKTA